MNWFIVIKNSLLNTLAFVTVSNSRKEITVTYRGTIVDLRNYLLDAALFQVGFTNIKFHFGFYVATMSLYNDVSHSTEWLFAINLKIVSKNGVFR